ncbi:hypothetical protein Aduo_017270 [Ancylostoma duodenale]
MRITLLLASGLVLISAVSARRGGGGGGCGQNEERKACGTRCEPTCTDPHPLCTRACVSNACQCRDGYLRDASNKCIRESACPNRPGGGGGSGGSGGSGGGAAGGPCGENEERKSCGSPCEPSCRDREPVCTLNCVPNVCQCRAGFFRNDENKCVRKKACRGSGGGGGGGHGGSGGGGGHGGGGHGGSGGSGGAPQMCGPHEEWVECSTCEPTCTNKNPACGFSCQPPKCQCNSGFFRNDIGECVKLAECRN